MRDFDRIDSAQRRRRRLAQGLAADAAAWLRASGVGSAIGSIAGRCVHPLFAATQAVAAPAAAANRPAQ
jgi:hypothetical protein